MKVIILTGSEMRHEYFQKKIARDNRIEVLDSFCEGTEKSLENRMRQNQQISKLKIHGPGPSIFWGDIEILTIWGANVKPWYSP